MTLRPWQSDALDAWEAAERRGVLEAATGAGKTTVALEAAARVGIGTAGSEARLVVLVPSTALQAQWTAEVAAQLGVDPQHIGHLGGEHPTPGDLTSLPVVIAILDSARAKPERITGPNTLLVVDECHRAASDKNCQALIEARWTLGLSATPKRFDDAERRVYDRIGDVFYRYTLAEAIDDGVLADPIVLNLYVELDSVERHRFNELSLQVRAALAELAQSQPEPITTRRIRQLVRENNPGACELQRLTIRRANIIKQASARREAMNGIAEWLARQQRAQSLVFHELTTEADYAAGEMRRRGIATAVDHSKLDLSTRREARERFRAGDVDALVAVHANDEGVDYPAAELAIILAGTRSRLQRIQRFGRVLRVAEPGKRPVIISVLALDSPEEWMVGPADHEIVGGAHRVRHHRWRDGLDALDAPNAPSTYDPNPHGRTTIADYLLAAELGVGENTQQVSAADAPAKNTWFPIDHAAALLGKTPQWVRNQLPRTRLATSGSTGPSPTGDVLHSLEYDELRRLAHARPKIEPPGQVAQRSPRIQSERLTDANVVSTAERCGYDRDRIARNLDVPRKDLDRWLKANPVTAMRIKRLAAA